MSFWRNVKVYKPLTTSIPSNSLNRNNENEQNVRQNDNKMEMKWILNSKYGNNKKIL